MAIDINIPSQVKNYANLAAFPVTGSLKTIFIAEDTNKTYRWTGSVYVEVSAAGATGITIGTTAITSGTVGRVLFEGTGNVVQESANLFWDNTNGRLGIGTSSPNVPLEVNGNVRITQSGSTTFGVNIATTGGATTITPISSTSNITLISQNSNSYLALAPTSVTLVSRGGNLFVNALNILAFENGASSTERARFATTTGNFLINTTTDAGFKLDVNGTARVTGTGTADANSFVVQNSAGVQTFKVNDLGQVQIGRTTAINWTFSSNTLSCTQYAFILSSNGSVLSTSGVGGVLANDTGAKICDQGVGALNQVASAVLECNSTTRGFLPPRMTTTQKNAIATPATGLMVYDTTLNLISVYNGTIWISL